MPPFRIKALISLWFKKRGEKGTPNYTANVKGHHSFNHNCHPPSQHSRTKLMVFFCVCWVKLWHIAQYQLPVTSGIYFNHPVSNYNAICYRAFQRAQTLIEAKQGSFYCIWVLLKPRLGSSESRSWHYEGEVYNRRKKLNSLFMTFNRAVWITGFSELSFDR